MSDTVLPLDGIPALTKHQIDAAADYIVDRVLNGQTTRHDAREAAIMLGLLPDPDVDNRPKRGHVKGGRGRAVPVDWTRRGAVGA